MKDTSESEFDLALNACPDPIALNLCVAKLGRGTGVDDKGLENKAEIITKALHFHNPDPCDGFDILRKIGGYEIAGIVGAALAAASQRTAIVLDGLISTDAGLIACRICPAISGYLIAGHKSTEPAQKAALEYMGLDPLIDFNMRLGEGTGAALAISMAEATCRIMDEMASFEEAGVSKRE
jgi:nicotinate-nucleotide--dimethylbenzimidazole phosphoribosyltransferase